jgi:transposase-like protein
MVKSHFPMKRRSYIMDRKKIDVKEDVKKQYVRMVLESGRLSSVAYKAEISKETLRKWVQEYEEEVRDAMDAEGITVLSNNPTKEELLSKYEHVLKLLGEKELEVAMLKNFLNKKSIE